MPQPATQGEDHAWYRGFAAALALLWDCCHDARAVRMIMKEASVSLEDLILAGVDLDIESIRAALGQA